MEQHRDPPHYLKPLSTTRTPERFLWLDCAAMISKEQGTSVARFHVAALGATHYTRRKHERSDTLTVYGDAQTMWSAASTFCTAGRRTVLFSYDLAQQIRVSKAMTVLPELGWTLDNIVLERTAAWALYRRDSRSLLMCDLKSWAPVELATIVADVTHGAVRGLVAQAGPGYRGELCRQRAGFVRDAVLQICNWIEGENLGPFRPTGSGQSYSAYRRRFATGRLLVHDDATRLIAERAAMHTGRCEAWRHGSLSSGPYVEYDMHAAYATIAQDCAVPTVAVSPLARPSVPNVKRAMQTYAVLAHVTVTTEIPCIPAHVANRTMWPVGTFTTWLWDPELQLAFDHADKIEVHHAYRYTRENALESFATFVLDGLGEQTQVYGLVPKRVLKHWSRCLVGRLGLRYRQWEKIATVDDTDLMLATVHDWDDRTSTDMLIAGHDWLLLSDTCESPESIPQIPSWVMSECRRRLWVSMLGVGLSRMVYLDTDSLIVEPGRMGSPRVIQNVHPGVGWTHKGTYHRMTIHGPRNYSTDAGRHVAGVPLKARQTAPLEFTGEVMRSVKESMRAGQLDCVASIPRKFVMDAPDLRRKHLPDGRTEPYRIQPTTQEDQL